MSSPRTPQVRVMETPITARPAAWRAIYIYIRTGVIEMPNIRVPQKVRNTLVVKRQLPRELVTKISMQKCYKFCLESTYPGPKGGPGVIRAQAKTG